MAGVGLAVDAAWLLTGPADYLAARDSWLYCLLFVPGLLVVLLRARVPDANAGAWWLLVAAAAVWLAGEVGTALTSGGDPAGAQWTQVLFLLVAPLYYAALITLVRRVLGPLARTTWLDGLILMLAAASMMALFGPQLAAGRSWWPELAAAMAYPALDLLQVTLILAAIAVLGRSTGTAWWLLLAGSVATWVADSSWLFTLIGSEPPGPAASVLLWPLGLTLIAAATWLPLTDGPVHGPVPWQLPLAVTAVAFAVILYATTQPVTGLSVTLAAGAVLAGAARSIGAFRAASAHNQVQRQAHTDDLTGLANRRGLVTTAGPQMSAQRALLLVDIDRFKQINDTLGHQAGDDVLQEVGRRFRDEAGADVVISRLGGDEFAVLLSPGTDWQDGLDLADRLHAAMDRPVLATGIELQVELSIGIATAPRHGTTLSALLLSSDRAMYRAKRDRVGTQVFDAKWDDGDTGSLLLLQELRRALERGEFLCYYQPQLDVLTNDVVSVEALIRWQHPHRGIIPAGQFLPMIEQTSMIRPLSDLILDMSLGQLRAWHEEGLDVGLSVNISATNLMDRGLPLRITNLLTQHQIDAARLTLEITETALSGDEDRVRVVLAQLHEIGVRISIDDYGSGYSSLHQVGTLGAHELKLDRQFVTGVGDRGDLRSILAATVHLAHGLRLRMVAEGVESPSDLDQVRLSGCDLAQGFYISPPRPGDVLAQWLRERQVRTGADRLRF
jgi:diguanylate cyclase (GGDEF)-like protein